MRPPIIRRLLSALDPPPNLPDYDAACRDFSWSAAARELDVSMDGPFNIAALAVDRHLRTSVRDRVALRFIARHGHRRDVTYAELAAVTNRFANVLRDLGVGKGDRVFFVADRIPELYIGVLGALKSGAVVSTLFSAFGPEPLETRLSLGEAKVLITTALIAIENDLGAAH